MLKYFIKTYGCQMNKSDSERIAGFLEKNGYQQSPVMEKSDLIVINMCSVRQTAVDRIFGLKPKFKKIKIQGLKFKTVLTGCFLPKDEKIFSGFFDHILKITNLPHWPIFESSGTRPHKIIRGEQYFEIKPNYSNEEIANVPISFGCNNFCSYCAVPYSRGREICRPAKDIINEVKMLVKKNYKEIWLLGQNVNSYLWNKIDFPKLLKLIAIIPGDFKIYFLSSHPKNFSDELIEIIANEQKIAKQIHLPVQSGDDKILQKMNRNYTVKQYKNLVEKIRRKIPDIFLSTDAIVGFPKETKKQFKNTAKLFKEIKFDNAYIAIYSSRPGTIASKMKDSVPKSEKRKRWLILNKIIEENKKKSAQSKKNKLVVVLGPTASGKSDLAIKLAKKFGGEIISTDSKQIYKGMNLGTAKINKKKMQNIPHHLLNIVSPKKQFNTADYQKIAVEKIKGIQKRNKLPFLVGGSPFYIFPITEGWIFPETKTDLRLRKRLEKKSAPELFKILKGIDKKRAENIDKNNKRRLVRAIEIAETIGNVPELKKNPQFNCLLIGIDVLKKELQKRISKRVDKMIENGLENEVKKLIKNKCLPVISQTIGYQEWLPYFDKKISKKEVAENIKKHTIQFAKHQMTWFKKKNINWLKSQKEAEMLIKKFLK